MRAIQSCPEASLEVAATAPFHVEPNEQSPYHVIPMSSPLFMLILTSSHDPISRSACDVLFTS